MKRVLTAALALGLLAAPAAAVPIVGADVVVASDGAVSAIFDGSDAGYDSEIWFGATLLFQNHLTSTGATVALGSFNTGDVLTFVLKVLSDGGRTYATGNGAGNPDGLAHAAVEAFDGYTKVGFEDIYGGGDHDYNDAMFTVTNTVPSVPLPAAGVRMLAGLGALGAMKRKR